MTLNQIVDDILLTCAYVDKERTKKLHRRQVESWIHEYRLLLLKQDISKNSVIDPTYISYIYFHFDGPTQEYVQYKSLKTPKPDDDIFLGYDNYKQLIPYDSIESIPELAPLIGRVGIESISVYSDNYFMGVATLSDIARPEFSWASRWIKTYRSLSASVYDGKLRIWKTGDALEKKKIVHPNPAPSPSPTPPATPNFEEKYTLTAKVGVILANVEDYVKYNRGDFGVSSVVNYPSYKDIQYPLEEDKIPRMKQMIFANELQWVFPARDTAQSSQMAKMEEQELQNNPTTLLQAGADLYTEI